MYLIWMSSLARIFLSFERGELYAGRVSDGVIEMRVARQPSHYSHFSQQRQEVWHPTRGEKLGTLMLLDEEE
jgi:hypothetical protein